MIWCLFVFDWPPERRAEQAAKWQLCSVRLIGATLLARSGGHKEAITRHCSTWAPLRPPQRVRGERRVLLLVLLRATLSRRLSSLVLASLEGRQFGVALGRRRRASH